jgi:uncharacterized protein
MRPRFNGVLAESNPLVQSLARAVRSGDVDGLAALLTEHPALAVERYRSEASSRAALHLVTDWPGNFPRAAEIISTLVAAGADVNARFEGDHRETPLHWAASCDDVVALDALLDAGADIEADGAVLTNGSPLADAVVFAQWDAARRLVERGAAMTIWQAAALGDVVELRRLLDDANADADADEVTNACWHACRAGQLAAAQLLSGRGADLDRVGHDHLTPRQAGRASGNADLVTWLE